MITNNYVFWDTETSSVDPDTTQVLSLGAVAVNPRTMEIIPGSEFYSLVRPEIEELLEAKAMEVNKLVLSELRQAPTIDVVWKNFGTYVDKYKSGKNKWGRPIPGGMNINNFDMIISRRLNARYKMELWHPFNTLDILSDFFRWFENDPEIKSLSFDNMRKYLGMNQESIENAHNALQDSKDAAIIAGRFIKLYRNIKPKFKGAFQSI